MDKNIFPVVIQNAANRIIGFKTSDERKELAEIKEWIGHYIEDVGITSGIPASNIDFHSSTQSILKSKKEIVENSLKILRERIDCQVASIFLFSKDGFLERLGIDGVDREGNSIPDSWFSDEKYRVGESFTGKTAIPVKNSGSRYGVTQYFPEFKESSLRSDSRKKYEELIGKVDCAIGIPLNGRNKTYGVLRVINKYDSQNNCLSEEYFSKEDIVALHFLATYISNALSNFRRDVQISLFRYLNQMLVRSSSEEELESVCQKVIDLIVRNPETAFKAGVLRLVNTKTDGGKLEIVAKSFADGVSGERNDDPREPEDGIVGKVFQSKQPAILQNIRNTGTISKFRNRNWILENEFEAFGSFPVLVKGEPLGTLSLYTGYNYDFHPDSIAFVNSITNYIASYIYSVRLELLKARYKEALGTDSLNTPLKEEEKQFLAGTNESDGFSESAARDNHNELEKLIVYMTGSASLGGILGQLPGVVLGTLSGVLLWYFTVNAKRNAA